jgi:hypothetical protein
MTPWAVAGTAEAMTMARAAVLAHDRRRQRPYPITARSPASPRCTAAIEKNVGLVWTWRRIEVEYVLNRYKNCLASQAFRWGMVLRQPASPTDCAPK